MKKVFFILLVVTGLSACSMNSSKQNIENQTSTTGKVENSTNQIAKITDTKDYDKKFVSFVATWCPHCQKEVPILEKFYSDYSGKIAMELNVLDKKPFPGVKLIPQNYKNPKSYKDFTNEECGYVPSYVVLDKNGKVIDKTCGAELTYDELKNKLLGQTKDKSVKQNLNNNDNKMAKVVKKGDKIAVDYIGFFEDGKVFDTSIKEEAEKSGIYNKMRTYKPLEFIVGAGQMIPCFDKAVEGMKIGEEKEIKCQPEEAYGKCDETKKQKVEKAKLQDFVKNGYKLEKGEELPTQYGLLKIVDADENTVTLDLNHPMCGKVLNFKIKLVDIK